MKKLKMPTLREKLTQEEKRVIARIYLKCIVKPNLEKEST